MQTEKKEEKKTTAYRFDEEFYYFLEKFGEPHDDKLISESAIESYVNKLPDQLFTYWRALGASGFHNGLLWMVNPEEYQDILDSWLESSPFEKRTDLSVIARSAFGELEVWAKNKKQKANYGNQSKYKCNLLFS